MARKRPKNLSKLLLVEGKQEQLIIPELIEANGIVWEIAGNPIVYIDEQGGYQNLIDPDVIATELQASGLSALGIILDADDNPLGRWQSIRNACLKSIPDIPTDLPTEGLIHTALNGVKLGIWIMPDNTLCGMLETFLAYMVPKSSDALWQFAQVTVNEAQSRGAPFKSSHVDNANIYTWLAWQEPPGRQLHQAVMEHILNPQHPNAQEFVTWFKTLYDLTS